MKSCAIVGNGPSALSLPADPAMPLFGMNFSPIRPDYYVCIDSVVLKYHWQEVIPLARAAKIVYLSAFHEGSSELYDLPNVILVGKDQRAFRTEQYMSGFNAAYVALKEAYYMGFEEVHLWGIDHDERWQHYRPDYPYGDTTTPARMEVMRQHFSLAARVYAQAGRTIINHSNPSKLDMIFRRENETQAIS